MRVCCLLKAIHHVSDGLQPNKCIDNPGPTPVLTKRSHLRYVLDI